MKNKLKKRIVLLRFHIRDSRIWLAQKAIELVFKIFRVTLVAEYVQEKKMVHLELVPTYLLKLKRKEEKLAKQILESEGDKINP